MTGVIATIPRFQFSNALGAPLARGKLYTYLAGTTTPAATYQDQDLTSKNENPIRLDATGSCVLWLDPNKVYKFVLKDALGITQPGWPVDNISGAAAGHTLQEALDGFAAVGGAGKVGSAAWYSATIVGFNSLLVPDGATVVFAGRDARNDGGGGAFTYVKNSTQTVDGGTVFAPAGGGRLFRQGWTVLGFQGDTNLLWWGAYGGFVKDDTAAIQSAINASAALLADLVIPARTYKLVPATAVTDESGSTLVAITMCNNMRIKAEKGAIFKIADNVSTDAAPKSMRMFASTQFLSGLKSHNLTYDMNGQNNKISPSRATFSFSRWTQAHICFSGMSGGVAAGCDGFDLVGNRFINGPGVSCIVMAQCNTAGVALGKNWTLVNNEFYNNGLDTDDHSSVFGWATDVVAMGNKFDNPAMFSAATHTGGLVAYEVHGSRQTLIGNTVCNYYQGFWIGANLTEAAVRDVKLIGNSARVSQTFSDFYSANLSTGASSESLIEHVLITGNVVEITADAVADQVKAFFKIGARKQPSMVRITNNICRNLDTTKDAVLVLVLVSPNQLSKLNQLTVDGNTAAGITAGMVVFFGGNGGMASTDNIASISYLDNDLGILVPPVALYQNFDVILYGGMPGRIESLRVRGLQASVPISVDAPAGGRATVTGKALVPVRVTWDGVTAIGSGAIVGRVALDTDAGCTAVSAQLIVGANTTFSGGAVFPRFTGLVADAGATVSGLATYTDTASILTGRVDNTGSWATMFSNSGVVTPASPAVLGAGSQITVTGSFPARSAMI